jgi:hypothetical protein
MVIWVRSGPSIDHDELHTSCLECTLRKSESQGSEDARFGNSTEISRFNHQRYGSELQVSAQAQ